MDNKGKIYKTILTIITAIGTIVGIWFGVNSLQGCSTAKIQGNNNHIEQQGGQYELSIEGVYEEKDN